MSDVVRSKVSVRFQTQIPKEIRFFLKVREGDFLVWERQNGQITVRKAEV